MTNNTITEKFRVNRPISIWIISSIALIFGFLTLKSGGEVLFIDGDARQAAGDYVPFVLWFNFVAGLFYIVAAIRLWTMKKCTVWLTLAITFSTLIIFALLAIHIITGGSYEMRTVYAMILRSVVWSAITIYSWNIFWRK